MKIRYERCYHGIQPGTVVDESPVNAARLTASTFFNTATRETEAVDPFAVAVPDDTPTTAELERAALVTPEPERTLQ